jgi:LysM repeat protein
MRKLTLTLVAFIISCQLFYAQELVKREVNGAKFYVHVVKTGETLFTISQLYERPQMDLMTANPKVYEGIEIGQELLIPVIYSDIDHTVQPKETVYGIARQYGVEPVAILNANTGADLGLKVGQKIRIPQVEKVPKLVAIQSSEVNTTNVNSTSSDSSRVDPFIPAGFSPGDSVVKHTVLASETLYSISKRYMVPVEDIQKFNGLKSTKLNPGSTINIPVKHKEKSIDDVRPVPPKVDKKPTEALLFPSKSDYKIAVLLPFFLDKKTNATDFVSGLSTEFYMGAKLAFDSLQSLGLTAEVMVFDTQNDTSVVKQIISKKEFQDVDLIYGPFYPDHIPIVANWAKQHAVHMVCPSAINTAVLKNNPFVYQAVPSDAQLMSGMANYIAKSSENEVVILIKSGLEKDQLLYDAFRSAYMNESHTYKRPKMLEGTLQNYSTLMKKGQRIVIVFPTNDKGQAVKFMNSFNSVGSKYNSESIRIFGTKDWVNFDEVKSHFKNRYNFHFAGTNDLNYSDEYTKEMNRAYRRTYNADLTKMAVQGYDVVRYFTEFFVFKKSTFRPIMNSFKLAQKGDGNGCENERVFIFEQEDFQLIRR